MLGFSTKQWAIFLTAVVHMFSFIWFAYMQLDFHPDKEWSYVKMNFSEAEKQPEEIKREEWVPADYQEHGLDQRKYSVAKTNEAINEATKQLSKGEQEQLQKEIDAQVSQMAKDASTSGFMEGTQRSNTGNISAPKKGSQKKSKKAGSEKGTSELGNIHNEATNITFYLKGRSLGPLGLYNPVYLCESGGKVVINIIVNSTGNVVSASVNDNMSKTKDPCLRKAAKDAALKSTFNEDQSADNRQRGIITYSFVAQ